MQFFLGLLLTLAPADSSVLVVKTSLPYTVVVRDSLFHDARRVENGDSLWLPTGSHTITFLHPNHFDESMQLTLAQGAATEVRIKPVPLPYREFWKHSSYFRVANKATVIVNTDDDTMVRVNGRMAGMGPQALNLDPGLLHTIILIPQIGQPVRHRVELTKYRFEVLEDYRRPRAVTTAFMGPFFGLAQFHKDEDLKGVVLMSTSLVALFMSGRHYGDAQEHRQSWFRHEELAQETLPGSMKDFYTNEATRSRRLYYNSMDLRSRWYRVMGVVSVLSFLDAFIPPEGGFRSRVNRISPILTDDGGAGLSFRYDL